MGRGQLSADSFLLEGGVVEEGGGCGVGEHGGVVVGGGGYTLTLHKHHVIIRPHRRIILLYTRRYTLPSLILPRP